MNFQYFFLLLIAQQAHIAVLSLLNNPFPLTSILCHANTSAKLIEVSRNIILPFNFGSNQARIQGERQSKHLPRAAEFRGRQIYGKRNCFQKCKIKMFLLFVCFSLIINEISLRNGKMFIYFIYFVIYCLKYCYTNFGKGMGLEKEAAKSSLPPSKKNPLSLERSPSVLYIIYPVQGRLKT